jgi:plasmid stabilization system protein ParE
MTMLVLVTDSDAMPAFERALVDSGDHGFTVVPTVSGRGRHGLHGGDRVHPGGSSVLFAVLPDEDAEATVRVLRAVRDRENVADTTRIFSLPAAALP